MPGTDCINGTYYSNAFSANSILGVTISDGNIIGSGVGVPWKNYNRPFIYYNGTKVGIGYTNDISQSKYDYKNFKWGIGGLSADYDLRKNEHSGNFSESRSAPRTLLAVDNNGYVYSIVTKYWKTFVQIEQLVKKTIPNIKFLIHLDSGGSTQMYIYGKANVKSYENRKVNTIFITERVK